MTVATEQDAVAAELAEDAGTEVIHQLNARPCSICDEPVRPGDTAIVYRRTKAKRAQGLRVKGVMHASHKP